MADDGDGLCVSGGFFKEIKRHALGGDFVHEGHVEILLPSGEGVVGAAEGNEEMIVVQQKREGGELGFGIRVKVALEAQKADFLIARAGGGKGGEQEIVFSLEGEAVLGGVVRIGEGGVCEGVGKRNEGLVYRFKVHVGQLRKDQPVDVVHGRV